MSRYFTLFVSLVLFAGSITTAQASKDSDGCLQSFQSNLDISGIQQIFSDKENYIKYRGQEGYLLFIQRALNTNSMGYIHQMVSKALGKSFQRLGWQKFQGGEEEYQGLRDKILNKDGSLKEEYIGMEGYARFAKEHYGGNMQKAFMNVSAVLDKALMKKTGWQQFQGTEEEYRGLRDKILNRDGSLKEEYIGMEGYARFAKEHYGGNMQKAFMNVSAVLDKALMKKTGWQQFQGTEEEYRGLRDKILNRDGSLKEKYIGMEGYARFAKEHYGGDMQKAFLNISAVLDKALMKKTGWQSFQGTEEEYQGLRDKILNRDGRLKEEYIGMEGYARFAKEHYGGNMQKAFMNVSAVLDKALMKKTGWQSFHGRVEEYQGLRDKILNRDGSLKEEYIGMEGYAPLCERALRREYAKSIYECLRSVG